jgi:DNA mismatch endonuclease (patch repair protein)
LKPDVDDTAAAKGETTDVLTPEQRRLVMSRIRGKDTKPEMLMRRGLHGRGLRYRLHGKGMPGKPDMVFPKYRTVVLVHGCFWHGHGCSLFKWPKTRAAFWKGKIDGNMERDCQALAALNADGWRALVVWECALKGKQKRNLPDVLDRADAFIRNSEKTFAEIAEYESIEKRAS